MKKIKNTLIRPPLKWAGNKFRILKYIKKRLPEGKRLVEPFAGSAAISLNTDYPEYVINDTNSDLINLYKLIKADVDEFIDYSRQFFIDEYNCEEQFYLLRRIFNMTTDIKLKTALFLYINKYGYNGLCRYNASGKINVPFGRYKKPYFPEKELHVLASKLSHSKLYSLDFEDVFKKAKAGDVFYCDPPYVPLSDTSNFTAYSAGGFSLEQQQRLADLSLALSKQGIPVVVSNHFTPITQKLYRHARKYKVEVRRLISCDGENRNMAKEVIAVYPANR